MVHQQTPEPPFFGLFEHPSQAEVFLLYIGKGNAVGSSSIMIVIFLDMFNPRYLVTLTFKFKDDVFLATGFALVTLVRQEFFW
jgi:hypothetical protein